MMACTYEQNIVSLCERVRPIIDAARNLVVSICVAIVRIIRLCA